ncbi:hypothetical protein V8F06_014679, partial [Rhypophila decipiens]
FDLWFPLSISSPKVLEFFIIVISAAPQFPARLFAKQPKPDRTLALPGMARWGSSRSAAVGFLDPSYPDDGNNTEQLQYMLESGAIRDTNDSVYPHPPLNMRGCERVRHLELVKESQYGQQHLPQLSFPCRYFVIKLILKRTHTLEEDLPKLRKFTGRGNSHIVPLLTFFDSPQGYQLAFPLEEGDIQTFWRCHPRPPCKLGAVDIPTLQWVCAQIHGLATAVDWLCDGEPSYPSTRAWRLDPDRIFWFYSKSNQRGVLAIHDFELPCNHIPPASSALMEVPSRRKAHDYLAPESVYANHIVAGPSDVWTLGCFALEMACWMLGGAEALAQFAVTRASPATFARHISSAATLFDVCYESDMTEESGPEFFQCDTFYQTRARDQSGQADEFVFRVHPAATMFMSGIHTHPACPGYLHDLLDLVEKQMLIVNPEKRAKWDTIVSKMASMLSSSVHAEFLSEPCPRPRNGLGLDGKAVLAFSDSSHQHSQLTRRPLRPKTAAMVSSRGLVRPLTEKEIRLLNLLPGEGDAAVRCTVR